jgi:hypothetical protein
VGSGGSNVLAARVHRAPPPPQKNTHTHTHTHLSQVAAAGRRQAVALRIAATQEPQAHCRVQQPRQAVARRRCLLPRCDAAEQLIQLNEGVFDAVTRA